MASLAANGRREAAGDSSGDLWILTGRCGAGLKLAAKSCSYTVSMLPAGGRTAAGQLPGQSQDLAGLCKGQLRHSFRQRAVWLQHSLGQGKGWIPEGQGHHQGQGCRVLGGLLYSCIAVTHAEMGLQTMYGWPGQCATRVLSSMSVKFQGCITSLTPADLRCQGDKCQAMQMWGPMCSELPNGLHVSFMMSTVADSSKLSSIMVF